MSWWLTAQSDMLKYAGILDWLSERTSIKIPALVIGALMIMKGIDDFVKQMKTLPTQEQRDQYAQTITKQVSETINTNEKIREQAEQFVDTQSWQTEQPTVEEPQTKIDEEPQIKIDKQMPRGIRNNNPGNIELGDSWQGMAKNQTDGRFIQFESPEYGIRAMARILRNYQRKYNLVTLSQIIKRWAPPSENDTNAYVQAVAKKSGVNPLVTISLENDELLLKIVKAMITHENGHNIYTDEQILKGIQMEKSP